MTNKTEERPKTVAEVAEEQLANRMAQDKDQDPPGTLAGQYIRAAISKYTRERHQQLEEDGYSTFMIYVQESLADIHTRYEEALLESFISESTNNGMRDDFSTLGLSDEQYKQVIDINQKRGARLVADINSSFRGLNMEAVMTEGIMKIIGLELDQFRASSTELWVNLVKDARSNMGPEIVDQMMTMQKHMLKAVEGKTE